MPNRCYTFSGNFIARHLKYAAYENFSSRLKKLLFVCSAAAVVLRDRMPDMKLLQAINEKIKSGYRTPLLLVPAYASGTLWAHLDNLDQVTDVAFPLVAEITQDQDAEIWRLGMLFATKCPDWLQYGSLQLMAADMHDALLAVRG